MDLCTRRLTGSAVTSFQVSFREGGSFLHESRFAKQGHLRLSCETAAFENFDGSRTNRLGEVVSCLFVGQLVLQPVVGLLILNWRDGRRA